MNEVCDERESYDYEVSMEKCDVKVKSLTVMDVLNAGEGKYQIPLYQRNYKWGYPEISQLVRDLWNNRNEGAYYLGSLVVTQRKDGNTFEVVDGQQRLTTLTLLYYRFDLLHKNPLSFENRQDAMDALTYIFDGEEASLFEDDKKGLFESFGKALKIIDDVCLDLSIGSKEEGKIKIKDDSSFLKNVKLFQVVLPKHTDVSAYFEVMNNRGRQLEAHEILKARMMAVYGDTPANVNKKCEPGETNILPVPCLNSTDFAKCWDACKGENPECPGAVFVNRVIKDEKEGFIEGRPKENGWEARITFPQLLLIALRCYCNEDNASITTETSGQKLLETFNMNFEYTKESVQKFILTLVQIREDFDSNVIRAFPLEDRRNKWGISPGRMSGQKEMSVDSPDENEVEVANTEGKPRDQKQLLRQELIMLQSLLEVSGKQTWVAEFLYKRNRPGGEANNIAILKEIIKADATMKALIKRKENVKVPNELRYGCLASRLVINVIDFLFWKKWEKGEEEGNPADCGFVFRYRNSIEHFYPQNEKWVGDDQWDEADKEKALDNIGNLYLVTGEQNSTLSRNRPRVKIQYWNKHEREMTPKQRRMYYTEDGKPREGWTAEDSLRHAEVCWKLLREFFNEPPDNGSKNPNGAPEVASRQDVQKSEFDNEQESRPECQEPVETSSQVSQWDVDDGIKRWWEKVEQALHGKLGELKDAEGHRWRELYLEHVEDYDHGHKDKGLIIRFCINRQVYIGTASINSETWNKMKEKYEPRAYIPLDEDCREWQDDELDELVEVLKRPTVEEILRGLRKSPESGGVPGQE